jgi:hypothetical protein
MPIGIYVPASEGATKSGRVIASYTERFTPSMSFKIRYERDNAEVGHPDKAWTLVEARLLASDGRIIYAADTAIVLSVGRDGSEQIVERVAL